MCNAHSNSSILLAKGPLSRMPLKSEHPPLDTYSKTGEILVLSVVAVAEATLTVIKS